MARQREPGGEREPSRNAGHSRTARSVSHARKSKRGHEREAERHRDERVTEPRPRDRREVAVEQPAERQLQRILGAEEERDDADVERGDDADAGEDVEPPLRPRASRRGRAAREAGNPSPPTTQRQRKEVQPAHDVLARVGPDAPNASVGGGAFARTPNVKTPETT